MPKKTVEDLSKQVTTLRERARSLGDDASPEARRKAAKAVRRAQRRRRTQAAIDAAKARRAAGKKGDGDAA